MQNPLIIKALRWALALLGLYAVCFAYADSTRPADAFDALPPFLEALTYTMYVLAAAGLVWLMGRAIKE